MKKYLLSLSFLVIATCAMAQSETNSPYSMFGLGKLPDQSAGASRGMNGVGLAFREGNNVNTLNPASYSAVDSLTFIFDLGMSLQNTNFREGNVSKNAKTACLEYAVGLFRLVKHVGMSFGILPYSDVGYEFSSKTKVANYSIAPATTTTTSHTQSYDGDGGIHQIFLGAGWETPFRGLSLGLKAAFIWGDTEKYGTSSFTDTYVKTLSRQYSSSVRSYKLDFGLQYAHKLGKDYTGSVGVTFSPGHQLNCDPECKIITANTQTSVNDTMTAVAYNALAIPTELGVGFALYHKNNWKVGLDYRLQLWGNIGQENYLITKPSNHQGELVGVTEALCNRHAVNAGIEYCQNEMGRSFWNRLRYRFGAGYATPYYKINGDDGPRDISISAGVGIPIMNSYNNRSILNVGFSWQNTRAKNYITENTLMLNIGITFNERWFAKWKFE